MEDSRSSGVEAAKEFLAQLRSDESINKRIDQVVDDQILAMTHVVAVERGFDFSREELESALVDELSLVDLIGDELSGPGQCNSSSGCRTPCVYCNSKALPSESELGLVIEQHRRGR